MHYVCEHMYAKIWKHKDVQKCVIFIQNILTVKKGGSKELWVTVMFQMQLATKRADIYDSQEWLSIREWMHNMS